MHAPATFSVMPVCSTRAAGCHGGSGSGGQSINGERMRRQGFDVNGKAFRSPMDVETELGADEVTAELVFGTAVQ